MKEVRFTREQVCAHRGASGSYPENTQIAFDAAALAGAGWIETDIQCLADGALVIFHDEKLGRTATGSAALKNLTWVDMADMDIGSWCHQQFSGQRPLRCEDLIQWQMQAADRPGIIWEVKCGEDLSIVDATVQAVSSRLSTIEEHRCVVSSFSRPVLSALRPLLPTIPIALIADDLPADALAFCSDHGLDGIHLGGSCVTPAVAQSVISSGLALRCYTINSAEEARRLTALGATMIMTDFPERLLSER